MKMFLRICLVLLALMLPCIALAELQLELSTECLAAESTVDFTLSGQEAEVYHYTLSHNGQELFSCDSAYAFGSYISRNSGEYTLTASAGNESARADFTVTEKMTCTLADTPAALTLGEPLYLHPQVTGGTGVYRYIYTITGPDGTSSAWESDEAWHWVAPQEGRYSIRLTVMDSIGAQVETEMNFTVEPGPGISLQPQGGALYAHGGQQSWRVYAPGPWTASTEADFILLDTSSGNSGDSLAITAVSATEQARKGDITITSRDHQLTLSAFQSASHGVDEELSMFAPAFPVQVDGLSHTAWVNASGTRSFRVTAAGSWSIECDADFIHAEIHNSELRLTVDDAVPSLRSGIVAVYTEDSAAFIHVYQPAAPSRTAVSAAAPLPEEAVNGFTLYSQSSGYWKNQPYGKSTLEQSGCAIFALSHALQYLGFEGEEITPEYLAAHYAFALREGGTINATLVGNVGDDLGYKTRYELYESLPTIRQKLQDGAVFSFAVVNGHIAMITEQSDDGTMFHVIDSAPSATWERIKNSQLYRRNADGTFSPITSLTELDGIRYYIENGAFGGADYWLEAGYVARRGVRLIQPEK